MGKKIKMGTLAPAYEPEGVRYITFCVTEDCNLRCKYCYMCGKNSFRKMSFETAKKAVDFFLAQEPTNAVVWDFIGGEPTLELPLIDKIVDYIKQRMYLLDHPWFNEYMISIGTNGLLYDSKEMQNFIKKNHSHLSVGITIDGTREKHDLNRVKVDGSGSYDDVVKNIPLWQKQFPNSSTKVTFASADLKYLKESIIHLWNLGLKLIPANVVFEDVWQEGDDLIFEEQLKELADYIIEHKMWEEYSVRFFDPLVGFPLGRSDKEKSFCGVGKMVAVDCDGKLYPCIRFLDFCMSGKPSLTTGSIFEGYNHTQDIFDQLSIEIVNDEECHECPVASGCFSCTGCNYEYSESNSIFNRTKFHCKMQKAQVRANEYFWDRLAACIDEVTPYERNRKLAYSFHGWKLDGGKSLFFILSDDITPHCMYESHRASNVRMSRTIFDAGLQYAHENHMIPVFLGDPGDMLSSKESRKLHVQMTSDNRYEPRSEVEVVVPVMEARDLKTETACDSCILLIKRDMLPHLYDRLSELLSKGICKRINIIKQDLLTWDDLDFALYQDVLNQIHSNIVDQKVNAASINVLPHLDERNHCTAGQFEFALAPNGKFYVCPAYYFNDSNDSVGDLETGIQVVESELFSIEKAKKCLKCDVNHCQRCSYLNKKATRMVNVPSANVCRAGEMEAKYYAKI